MNYFIPLFPKLTTDELLLRLVTTFLPPKAPDFERPIATTPSAITIPAKAPLLSPSLLFLWNTMLL